MDDDAPRTLAEIEEEMKSAIAELKEADDEYDAASRRQSTARNHVNRLQKEIDGRLDGLRWAAPQGTDWRDTKLRRDQAA